MQPTTSTLRANSTSGAAQLGVRPQMQASQQHQECSIGKNSGHLFPPQISSATASLYQGPYVQNYAPPLLGYTQLASEEPRMQHGNLLGDQGSQQHQLASRLVQMIMSGRQFPGKQPEYQLKELLESQIRNEDFLAFRKRQESQLNSTLSMQLQLADFKMRQPLPLKLDVLRAARAMENSNSNYSGGQVTPQPKTSVLGVPRPASTKSNPDQEGREEKSASHDSFSQPEKQPPISSTSQLHNLSQLEALLYQQLECVQSMKQAVPRLPSEALLDQFHSAASKSIQIFSQLPMRTQVRTDAEEQPSAFTNLSMPSKIDQMTENLNFLSRRIRKNKKITECPHTSEAFYSKGMCRNCYHAKGRKKPSSKCEHTNRPNYALGLCKNCYLKKYHRDRRNVKAGEENQQKAEGSDQAQV